MFTPAPATRRHILSEKDKSKLFKKLRVKYIEKYGLDKKIVIDDVVLDFLNCHDHKIEHFDFVKLDKYIETRLTGIVSEAMSRYSYVDMAAKRREQEKRRKQTIKRKKTYSRDCKCSPGSQRKGRTSISWRPKSETKKSTIEASKDDKKAAGFRKKIHPEKRQ